MSKRSIYYIFSVFLAILITFTAFSMRTRAHSPEGMNLNYNSNAQILYVSITHNSADNSSHYVNSVTIYVNGSGILSTPYTSQPSLAGGLYQFSIAANNGSSIQAIATCNQGGSISACIIVGIGPCTQDGGLAIPGYLGLWVIVGVSVIVSLIAIYKKLKL